MTPPETARRAVLVTGSSGFVGRRLIERLAAEEGHPPLRLLDLQPFPTRLPDGAEGMLGSIESASDVLTAVEGIDVVVHVAAFVQPTSSDADKHFRVNATAAQQLFVAAAAAGCRQFIHVSSAGVYGDPRGTDPLSERDEARPVTPYQRSKWDAEQRLLAADPGRMVLNIIRPTGIFGAGSHLELARYRRLLRRHWSLALRGGMYLNPVHVSDVAAAITALLSRPAPQGTIYNVGGGERVHIDSLDDLVARELGVPHRRFVIPPLVASPVAWALSRALAVLGRPRPMLRAYAAGRDFSVVIDDSAFRSDYPGVLGGDLATGVREQLRWAREESLLEE